MDDYNNRSYERSSDYPSSNRRSYNNREPRSGGEGGGSNGGSGGGGGGGGGGGYRSNNFSNAEKSVIQIPGAHIGKIIGPAGRHINDLQRQFNVRIQISKQANDDGTKDAEVSGANYNDIQDAIKAINEKIEAPFERRGGGGGDFRGGRGGGGGYERRDREGYQPRGDRSYGERREGGSGGGGGGYRGGDREERNNY